MSHFMRDKCKDVTDGDAGKPGDWAACSHIFFIQPFRLIEALRRARSDITASIRCSASLRRRFLPFLLAFAFSTLYIAGVFNGSGFTWNIRHLSLKLSEKHGPTAEQIATGHDILPNLRDQRVPDQWHQSSTDESSTYPKGQTKPPGNSYTKRLVISRMKRERSDWIEQELGDMINNASLTTAVYTVNDRKAKLHPPKNKGHEVMVYLSYIIDHYETLADVNIFMHAHRFAWHNEEILDGDAVQAIRLLSAERVVREGYMNLRCQWDPGCPEWLFPENTKPNRAKQEEVLLASIWPQLFPEDPIPRALAQPCCAQFAVSRERIQLTNKTRYINLRDWLIHTDVSDYLSGRVFEYVWQFIFNGTPLHCPSIRVCYCDGFGICFDGEEEFQQWTDLMLIRNKYKEELVALEKGADFMKDPKQPEMAEYEELTQNIATIEAEMRARKQKAIELGNDPKQRASQAGRSWQDGDGY